MLASIDQKLLWARCPCTAREAAAHARHRTSRANPIEPDHDAGLYRGLLFEMYAWLCSACFHGTSMRNTTGERVHIAARAARQKNRPSFGHFSTWEWSREVILGVLETPEQVVDA